jgi:DNA (cytosine-5)-methyltransferase 1
MAVEAFFDAETVWTSDIDKYASKVIAERIKKPNLGDLKQIDWTQVDPIDILTAGYPCQPFSHAGQRKGTNDERHIFPYILQAISTLRPKYVVLENVRGHLSLGFKEVLAGLASNGYTATWRIVRASDAGAPHQRARLFIVAYPDGSGFQGTWHSVNDASIGITTNTDSNARQESRRADRSIHGASSEIVNGSNRQKRRLGFEIAEREVPPTLAQNKLNPKFVEYMMGLPEGWVTNLELSRSQQLKILGNGVVPQQAYLALELLVGDEIVDN